MLAVCIAAPSGFLEGGEATMLQCINDALFTPEGALGTLAVIGFFLLATTRPQKKERRKYFRRS